MGIDMKIIVKGLYPSDKKYKHYVPRGTWPALFKGIKTTYDFELEKFLDKDERDYLAGLVRGTNETDPKALKEIISKVLKRKDKIKVTADDLGENINRDTHLFWTIKDVEKLYEFLKIAAGTKKKIICELI